MKKCKDCKYYSSGYIGFHWGFYRYGRYCNHYNAGYEGFRCNVQNNYCCFTPTVRYRLKQWMKGLWK